MKKIIFFLSIFVVCIAIGIVLQLNRESKLEKSITIKGIIIFRDDHLTRGWGARVKYYVADTKYVSGVRCDCRSLEIGDTVLIKYAVEDPQLAVMVDKNYMQKYKKEAK